MNKKNHYKENLPQKLLEETGISVSHCYQCGKCTAGCPLTPEMDLMPSQILHMLQLDFEDHADEMLGSYSIWLCVNCETCYSRCPQEVDIPKMMDFLRSESVRMKKVNPRARDVFQFHRSFLDTIRFGGRLYELAMIAGYKMRTRHFLQDVLMAPKLFFAGKLKLFPHLNRDKKGMARIFKNTLQLPNHQT